MQPTEMIGAKEELTKRSQLQSVLFGHLLVKDHRVKDDIVDNTCTERQSVSSESQYVPEVSHTPAIT